MKFILLSLYYLYVYNLKSHPSLPPPSRLILPCPATLPALSSQGSDPRGCRAII